MTNKEFNVIMDKYRTLCERYNQIINESEVYETEIDYINGGLDTIKSFINMIEATIKRSYDVNGFINHFYLEADVFGATQIATRKIRKPRTKREA